MKNVLTISCLLFFLGCSVDNKPHTQKNDVKNPNDPAVIFTSFLKKHPSHKIDSTNVVFIQHLCFAVAKSNKCDASDCAPQYSPVLLIAEKDGNKWAYLYKQDKILPNPTYYQDNPFERIGKINDSTVVFQYNFGTIIEHFVSHYFRINTTNPYLLYSIDEKHDWGTGKDVTDSIDATGILLKDFDFNTFQDQHLN